MTLSEEAAVAYPVVEEFNHFAGQPAGTYFTIFDDLRTRFPYFRSTFANGFWVFTDSAMIREAHQRPDLFSSRAVIVTEPDPPYQWIPEMLDPPEHTRWRQLLAPMFAPARVATMEAKIRQRCVELIDEFADRGSCAFLEDFAWRFPTSIFMELMGLPVAEADRFLAWEAYILHGTLESDPNRSLAYQAMQEVTAYFDDLVEQRRLDPRDDIVSAAITWEIDGAPIPKDALLAFCLLLFMAGLDTVAAQLSYGFLHLATHPADRERIVGDPAVIPQAVEELLRAYSIVIDSRKVTRDGEFHGCPLKAGDMVLLPLCSANRDPEAFAVPTEVDFDRPSNAHIAFGAGPHRCLGSHLARLELKVAFEEWHARIPDYRLGDEDVPEHGGMLGVDRLPLVW